jgi:ribosomal protein S18 acetylase RimI-like enzyme
MTIRTGTPADETACVEIWLAALEQRDGFPAPPSSSERAHAKFLRPTVRLAVAESDLPAGIRGFALTVRDTNTVALLELLAVAPDLAGRGKGKALLDDAIASAVSSGYRYLDLWVRRGNDRAVALYCSRGFAATGGIEVHPLGGEPMMHYRCDLG